MNLKFKENQSEEYYKKLLLLDKLNPKLSFINKQYIFDKGYCWDILLKEKRVSILCYHYARDTLKGPFPEGEEFIASDDYYYCLYITLIKKEVSEKAERLFIDYYNNHPSKFNSMSVRTTKRLAFTYFMEIKNDINIEFNNAIMDYNHPYNTPLKDYTYHFYNKLKNKHPEFIEFYEKKFCNYKFYDDHRSRPHILYEYIKKYRKEPLPMFEAYILKNTFTIYCYSKNILKQRWPEGEKVLLEDKWGRTTKILVDYAKYVIKDRWPEAEDAIMNSDRKDDYLKFLTSIGK